MLRGEGGVGRVRRLLLLCIACSTYILGISVYLLQGTVSHWTFYFNIPKEPISQLVYTQYARLQLVLEALGTQCTNIIHQYLFNTAWS